MRLYVQRDKQYGIFTHVSHMIILTIEYIFRFFKITDKSVENHTLKLHLLHFLNFTYEQSSSSFYVRTNEVKHSIKTQMKPYPKTGRGV